MKVLVKRNKNIRIWNYYLTSFIKEKLTSDNNGKNIYLNINVINSRVNILFKSYLKLFINLFFKVL
jgi:hypothetical protein